MIQTLDRISIELKVTAVQMNTKIWMQGYIEISINGEQPYENGEIVDIPNFLKSLEHDGNYFIFCCHCGYPECTGRKNGIEVLLNETTTKWIDNFSNKTWIFDKNKIEEDLKNINEQVRIFKKYFAEKQIDYVGFGYES